MPTVDVEEPSPVVEAVEVVTPEPKPEVTPQPWTDEEMIVLARRLWGEARGVNSDAEKAACVDVYKRQVLVPCKADVGIANGGAGKKAGSIAFSKEVSPTLKAGASGLQAPVVAIPYTLKIRSGCEGGGKGALIQEDKSATLSVSYTHLDVYKRQG